MEDKAQRSNLASAFFSLLLLGLQRCPPITVVQKVDRAGKIAREPIRSLSRRLTPAWL